jgi:hypothetical protein
MHSLNGLPFIGSRRHKLHAIERNTGSIHKRANEKGNHAHGIWFFKGMCRKFLS